VRVSITESGIPFSCPHASRTKQGDQSRMTSVLFPTITMRISLNMF
jgi:hypothetical protein